MPDVVLNVVPSTPDAATVTQGATLVRAILMLSSGVTGAVGIVMPQISDAQLNLYVTAALIVWSAASAAGTIVWGWWKNRKKAQEAHADNVATAVATAKATLAVGAPVPVPVEASPIAVAASPVAPVSVVVPSDALTTPAPTVPQVAVS